MLRLDPPYQDFVFQDEQRAYLASPVGYESSATGFHRSQIPARSIKNIQVPLVEAAYKKRAVVNGVGQSVLDSDPQSDSDSTIRSATIAGFTAQASSSLLAHVPATAVADLLNRKGLRFDSLVHPHVCAFRDALTKYGIPGLLSRSVQQLNGDPGQHNNAFVRWYAPTSEVAPPFPREHVDFGRGASSIYNWELFFHVPMLVAESLMRNQRFEDAMHWFHCIFNPTSSSGGPVPERFWNCLPFFNNSDPERDSVRVLLLTLAGHKPGWQEVADQIEEWRRNPFNPHLIARLRITAYQKNVVMKYVDNLIAWGDQLFRRDTIESINEATLLYVLANEVLGPRPQALPPAEKPAPKTYSQLAADLDQFGNLLVEAEQFIPYNSKRPLHNMAPTGPWLNFPGLAKTRIPLRPPRLATVIGGLYFCPPQNQELLARWDTVADRLFKIRHCMNIEGVVRELPLFEPPIDPALLVRATAAGIDIGTVLDDLHAGLPHYRFVTLVQKANELCAEVRSMGAALLVALEKRDSEELLLLGNTNERALLELVAEVRQRQYDLAVQNRQVLESSKEAAVVRFAHYQRMLGEQPGGELREVTMSGLSRVRDNLGVKMIEHEANELEALDDANDSQHNAVGFDVAANIAYAMGDHLAAPFGAGIKISVGDALSAFASYYRMQAANLTYDATLSAKLGQYVMRAADWTLQNNLAVREVRTIERQMLAADIGISIAEGELNHHRKQVENSKQVEEFLRGKFSSKELYNWLVGQTSTLYFQAYQLAFDMARRAERAFAQELGVEETDFIRFGYRESLKKGLLAGERLQHDLRRMEAAYLEQNRRELEIIKHISIAQFDPLAFVTLKETGKCAIILPEALFDMDFPGHYFRRIKSMGPGHPMCGRAVHKHQCDADPRQE